MARQKISKMKSWKRPIVIGSILSAFFCLMYYLSDYCTQFELMKDLISIALQFSFTFIAVLLALFTILFSMAMSDNNKKAKAIVTSEAYSIFIENSRIIVHLAVILLIISLTFRFAFLFIINHIILSLIIVFLISCTMIVIAITSYKQFSSLMKINFST